MGQVFVTSKSSVNRHGAFAIERQPPAIFRPDGTGVAAMVAQFPWGRDSVVVTPANMAAMLMEIAPPGMSRVGSGYLSAIAKAFPILKFVRAVGNTAAKATSVLTAAGPVNVVTVTAKYKGLAGNSLVATVKAASDGDANHFDLDVTITGASGTTIDAFQNLNFSAVGSHSAPDLTRTRLVGGFTSNNNGRPTNGNYTFTTGADGTLTAADYVGTAGAPDEGLSLLENDSTTRQIFVDDPSNALRATVNAGGRSHAESMGDRVFYMNGNTGQTSAQAITDVGNYRSARVAYCDPWVYINDDTDGTKRLVPGASFAASVASQVPGSTSIAWKGDEIGSMLRGIVELETPRGNAAGLQTQAGIITFIEEELGGFRFEADPVTIAPVNPAKKSLRRTRVGDAIALAFVRGSRSFVDAPNLEASVHQPILNALDRLLSTLKLAAQRDPLHELHIKDYTAPIVESTQEEIDAGDFEVSTNVKTSSAAERIFLSFAYGETVQVRAA